MVTEHEKPMSQVKTKTGRRATFPRRGEGRKGGRKKKKGM